MIVTQADWNAHLGCCCGMPECPEPVPCVSTYQVALCGWAVYSIGAVVPYVGVLCASATTEGTFASDTGWVASGPDDEFREIVNTTLTHVQEREHLITFPGQACGAFLYTSGSYSHSLRLQGRTDGAQYDWSEITTASPGADASSSFWPGVFDIAPGYFGYPGGDPGPGYPADVTVQVHPGVAIPSGGSWVDAGDTVTWTRTDFVGYDTITVTYNDPYRIASARAALAAQSPDFPVCTYGLTPARYDAAPVSADDDRVTAASILHVLVQWRVPTSHLGSYFKVTFDVIDEPDGWEAEETDPRTFFALDVTREWTGPGSGPHEDPSWLLGAPYLIEPPSTPGTRRIVNIRYECYRGEEPAP